MTEKEKLFNYKGTDIIIRKKGKKYQIGICGKNQLDIWFESVAYKTFELAVNSGREYARIIIDRMLLSEKKNNWINNQF